MGPFENHGSSMVLQVVHHSDLKRNLPFPYGNQILLPLVDALLRNSLPKLESTCALFARDPLVYTLDSLLELPQKYALAPPESDRLFAPLTTEEFAQKFQSFDFASDSLSPRQPPLQVTALALRASPCLVY